MSLLLQALQKAAKSRAEGDTEDSADALAVAQELALEPTSAGLRPSNAEPASSPAQAATVVQAGRVPAFDPVDYAREHYMVTFIGVALLFAVGYAAYVYMQLNRPFRNAAPAPFAAAPAPQVPVANAPPLSASAKISGMPGAGPTDDGARAQKVATVPESDAAPPGAEPSTASPALSRDSAGLRAEKRYARTGAAKQAAPTLAAAPPMSRQGNIEPVALADASDTIETVVIPASRSKSSGDISVHRDAAGITPVSPTLMQAYETLQRGDISRAKELYGQVLQADPRNIDALLGLASIALTDSRTDDASRYYQSVLDLDPRNSYAQAGLISIIGSADVQASEARLKQLIARDPSAFLYFSLGNLYAEQGQWPAAQQAYYQAFQMQQDNPDFAFNLAIGLEHIGQNRLALDYYRKALDLSFKKGHANFDQSLVIQRVGQLSTRIEQ